MSHMMMTQPKNDERLPTLLVIGVVLAALLLGWVIKENVTGQGRPFSQNGVSGELPAGWLTQDGTGDLLLVARNPQAPDERYRINRLTPNTDLAALAAVQNGERARLEPTFRVVEETPIVVNGRDGYKVSYAYIDDSGTGMPAVIEGVDYYFLEGDAVLVISLEAAHENFAEAFPRFQTFRDAVVYEAGG